VKDKADRARTDMPATTLRLAKDTDCDLLYSWQTEEARRYFNDPNVPELSNHRDWFHERMARGNSSLWIIERGAASAGYVRLDRSEAGREGFVVSVLIDQQFQGRGIATLALKTLRELVPGSHLWAEIHPDNVASRKAFKKAGYQNMSPTLMVSRSIAADLNDTVKLVGKLRKRPPI